MSKTAQRKKGRFQRAHVFGVKLTREEQIATFKQFKEYIRPYRLPYTEFCGAINGFNSTQEKEK